MRGAEHERRKGPAIAPATAASSLRPARRAAGKIQITAGMSNSSAIGRHHTARPHRAQGDGQPDQVGPAGFDRTPPGRGAPRTPAPPAGPRLADDARPARHRASVHSALDSAVVASSWLEAVLATANTAAVGAASRLPP